MHSFSMFESNPLPILCPPVPPLSALSLSPTKCLYFSLSF